VFKSKSKRAAETTASESGETEKVQTPVKSELELAAERESRRGSVIANLASEAKMWREFAGGCKPGRSINEMYARAYQMLPPDVPLLWHTMDEISAESWKAFALSMTAIAERRLREVLGTA
jgi:hypothetical protein